MVTARALRHGLAGTALCLATVAATHAATPLMIWPVDPVITEEQPAVALWVENRGTTTVSLQVRVLDWSQTEGEEFFATQKEVLASPPISAIPAGKRQMIRLIATQPTPPESEAAYRVVIDELPTPADQGQPHAAGSETGMGIRLQVRYAIPLFVYGTGAQPFRPAKPPLAGAKGKPLPPALSWQTVKEGNKHRLVLRNQGAGHARITAVQWSAGSRELLINEGLLGYVLPYSQMRWELDAAPPPHPVLKATINGRETLVPSAAK